jgi:hypothetical protein
MVPSVKLAKAAIVPWTVEQFGDAAALHYEKYPATKDFGDTAATLPSYARGDGGNGSIIVHPR